MTHGRLKTCLWEPLSTTKTALRKPALTCYVHMVCTQLHACTQCVAHCARNYSLPPLPPPESHVRTHIFSLSSRQMWSAGRVSTTRIPSMAIILARTKVSRFQGQWHSRLWSFLRSQFFRTNSRTNFQIFRKQIFTFKWCNNDITMVKKKKKKSMFFSSIYRVNYGGIKIRSFRWRRFFAKQVKVFRKRVKKKKNTK